MRDETRPERKKPGRKKDKARLAQVTERSGIEPARSEEKDS